MKSTNKPNVSQTIERQAGVHVENVVEKTVLTVAFKLSALVMASCAMIVLGQLLGYYGALWALIACYLAATVPTVVIWFLLERPFANKLSDRKVQQTFGIIPIPINNNNIRYISNMQITVTIKSGVVNSITRQVEAPVTVASLLTAQVKSSLGVGENTQAVIDGTVVSGDYIVNRSCTIRLETVAASKAA